MEGKQLGTIKMKCVGCYYDWNYSKQIKERGINWFLELKKIKK